MRQKENSSNGLVKFAKDAKDNGLTYGQLQALEYAGAARIHRGSTPEGISVAVTSHSKTFSPKQNR